MAVRSNVPPKKAGKLYIETELELIKQIKKIGYFKSIDQLKETFCPLFN